MKAPVKKKKPPVKKPKVGTVKSPEETRKSISRKQVGTSRPARNVTSQGAKARALTGVNKPPGTSLTVTNKGSLTTPNKRAVVKTGEQVAQNARNAITKTAKNAVGFAEKWIPNAMKPKGGGMSVVNKVGGVATAVTSIVNPDFANFKTEKQKEAAKESGKPSGSVMKSNMPGGYGSKTSGYGPTPKKKASVSMPKASMSGGGVNKPSSKSSAGSPFSKGKGNAALPKGKTSPSNTAATSAAASSSGGTSKAASASKAKVGKQTKYQRESLAMEQRRSSGKPKKSIFSLFRKG